jgi:GNAT superfamily N-acetyltransferase
MIPSPEVQAGTEHSGRTGGLRRTLRILRLDGLGRALWRIGRKILSPALNMEAYFIFDTSLAEPAPADCPGGVQVRIYQGLESLESVQAQIASMGLERAVEPRLVRGEAVVIVSEGTRVVGFTWAAFADMPAQDFELTVIVPPSYVCHYDSLVLPGWRGRGIAATMVTAAKQFARNRGCQRSVSWINVLNLASLRLPQRWNRRHGMTILYLRLRGFSRPVRVAFGQPLGSRFRKA